MDYCICCHYGIFFTSIWQVLTISNKIRWALSSATKFNVNNQGFNLVDFYCNIITTFNVPIDYDSNYELDDATTTWIKDTLHWWQMYVYHIRNIPGLQRGSTSVSSEGDDSNDEESDLTKLLASQKMKADDFQIDPALMDLPSAPNSSSTASPGTSSFCPSSHTSSSGYHPWM